MVWVYGGAFYSGSNNLYGMERIGDVADVILVAINYRIGSLGIILKNALQLCFEFISYYNLLYYYLKLNYLFENFRFHVP